MLALNPTATHQTFQRTKHFLPYFVTAFARLRGCVRCVCSCIEGFNKRLNALTFSKERLLKQSPEKRRAQANQISVIDMIENQKQKIPMPVTSTGDKFKTWQLRIPSTTPSPSLRETKPVQ